MEDRTDSRTGVLPLSTMRGNRTITASDIRTVQVSNVSLAASKHNINEFFSCAGQIQYVEMLRESERTQLVYVTFKDSLGADTAMLLMGGTIADFSISIASAENYKLPSEAFLLDKVMFIGEGHGTVVTASKFRGGIMMASDTRLTYDDGSNINSKKNFMIGSYAFGM